MSGEVQVHVAVREDDPGKNPGASVEELRDQRSLEDIQARGAVQGVMPGREARACSPVCGIGKQQVIFFIVGCVLFCFPSIQLWIDRRGTVAISNKFANLCKESNKFYC